MTQMTWQRGANLSGLDYRLEDNDAKQAIVNHHKGASAPSYAEGGIIWLDDTTTPWALKIYDGADWITLGEVNASTNAFTPFYGTASPRLLNYATDSGAANAYAIAPVPAVTSYVTGQMVTLKPANANTTASTIAINGMATKNIKTLSGSDPSANMLLTTGIYILVYDGTNFVLLNPSLGTAANAATGTSGHTLGFLDGINTYSKAQIGAVVALTSTSNSTAIDLSLSNNFSHTFTENTTFADPTNMVAGQGGTIYLTQDAGTPRTIAWGSKWKEASTGVAGVVSTTLGAKNIINYSVQDTSTIWYTLNKGGVA